MHFSSITVNNYKGIRASAPIRLDKGLNIFVGANNSGKTAALEVLTLMFGSRSHLSLRTKPEEHQPVNPNSEADVDLVVSGNELVQALHDSPNQHFILPMPYPLTPLGRQIGVTELSNASAAIYWRWLYSQQRLEFRAKVIAGAGQTTPIPADARRPSLLAIPEPWPLAGNQPAYLSIISNITSVNAVLETQPNKPDISHRLVDTFRKTIYYFRANRVISDISPPSPDVSLNPDGGNLAAALNYLRSNPEPFEEFVNLHVSTVFPDVKWIELRPMSANAVQIFIWFHDKKSRRPDLAIPLSECGVGLRETIAMLYVVFTSQKPRTIIIDEPNSFLHPGAIRRLIDVFRCYPQHQYIISTHSPTLISAARVKSMVLVTNPTGETEFLNIDVAKAEQLKIGLNAIGSSLADVFGADRVLWVEGATEQSCFPKIVEAFAHDDLMVGTVILGVRSTGDFEGKHASTVIDVYRSMAGSASLLPPAVAFIFDHELRTESQKSDIRKRAEALPAPQPKVFFTKRRTYENYLMKPSGLAALLNEVDLGKSWEYSEQEIENLLSTKLKDKQYFKGAPETTEPYAWADAPQLLQDLFSLLPEARVSVFDKTRYSVWLTDWLLKNAPAELSEVAELIAEAFR